MATPEADYYCHKCQIQIGNVTNMRCPRCKDTFIEEIPSQNSSSFRRTQPRSSGQIHFHGRTPFGHTTIVFGSNNSSNNEHSNNDAPDIGTFFQALLSPFVGGSPGAQLPFMINNGRGGTSIDPSNLDAFLTYFLNQLGENSGPAPASENRINSIPSVRITSEQARDNLQCAICMDEFKENDQAKRLPCSHHFHEECILRWLRLHGTCPTCRVTLDGDNTTNREYHNFYPNTEQSSWNNNRRNNGDNNGSDLMDFD